VLITASVSTFTEIFSDPSLPYVTFTADKDRVDPDDAATNRVLAADADEVTSPLPP
jgi:hypothetical protein